MKLRNLKLTMEYDGTQFHGWQVQEPSKRTIQGEIEKVLKIIFKKKITLIGSGRTDSGVHALGQVAHFKTNSAMPAPEILKALNGNLPEDIVVLDTQDVPLDFHAQYKAKRKTYRYTICNRPVRCALHRRFCLYLPQRLNFSAMRKASRALLGRKDFRSFAASDPHSEKEGKKKTTIRRIFRLKIRKKKDIVTIDIEANGFLYKMARTIVGTLLKVGLKKWKEGSIKAILKAKNRTQAAPTAPARGLCLLKVIY